MFEHVYVCMCVQGLKVRFSKDDSMKRDREEDFS